MPSASSSISATYLLETAMDPERAADIIAGEQSSGTFVPIPGEDEALKARAAAKWNISVLEPADAGHGHKCLLKLTWPLDNLGVSLPNLLATVAGNLYELRPVISLRLLDIELPEAFAQAYPGPGFGIAGTRKLAGVPSGPLVGTIIKPSVGLSADAVAAMVDQLCAAGVDFISFFRHIAQLPIDYSKWQHYEAAATHAGWRFMHPDFCIVVDFPLELHRDEQARPHCESGPSHRWSDGFQFYHWHGYRIPEGKEWIIADKARITPDAIEAEENAELRRIMLEIEVDGRTGFDRYREARGAKVIDADNLHGRPRQLLSIQVRGEEHRIIDVLNGSLEPDGSRRQFLLGAARNPRTRDQARTVHEAVALSYGIDPGVYSEGVRT